MVLPKFITYFVKCKLNVGLLLDAVVIEIVVAVEIAAVLVVVGIVVFGIVRAHG